MTVRETSWEQSEYAFIPGRIETNNIDMIVQGVYRFGVALRVS